MSGIAITFPSSPVEGQSYLAQNGFTYIYDSQKNRWKRGGDFVRAPKVLSFAGVAVTTTGSGITTGPNGALIYRVPGFLIPSSDVGVDSYKAYRYTDSYPNYTEIQVSISSAFSTIAYAATSTSTTFSIPAGTLSGDTTYYVRARQFVGSNASTASTGAISGYSQNIVSFATTSLFLDAPTIVSIAGSTRFPVYQIGFAGTTLPATVTYTGSGLGNLQRVEWRVTGPRNPDSTGDVALAEVGIGTFSSATLANALVLAMPFSGATGVGITNDVNGAIRTASGASAGITKTFSVVGGASTVAVGVATTTAHFYPSAAYFDGTGDYITSNYNVDFNFGTGDLTVEMWVNPDNISGIDGLYATSGGSGGNPKFVIHLDAGTPKVHFNNLTGGSNIYTNATSAISPRIWTHLAYVRKNSVWSWFINGIISGSGTNSTDITFTTQPTYVGYGGEGFFTEFNGYIQDLKVYKGLAKYQENFTPPLPTYGTISYTTRTIGSVGVATTAFFESTGDIPTAEASSTAANALVLAMPMNRTFGFQDINVAVRGLTSGASAGTAKTVGLGTTSTANAPSHPIISSTESKWYDGAAYFYNGRYALLPSSSDYAFGTGDYTIEGWFYRGGTTGGSSTNRVWIGTQNIGVPVTGFLIFDTSGTLYYYQADNTAAITTTNIPPLNTWNHLAVTRSGTTVRMFINGVLIASATSSVNHSASNSVFIGGDTSGSYYFEGYMQDLKIYKGLAKYTANFTPPQPICGFTTNLAIQTGFTTTTATGALLSSVVGLGSTSTLSFGADQNLVGVTSITSSSGITTLPDPYAQNLVLALPLANITGVGNSFTNDRNTQIRSVSLVGGGTTKTITNSGIGTTTGFLTGYSNIASGFRIASPTSIDIADNVDIELSDADFTIELWVYLTNTTNQYEGIFSKPGNSDQQGYMLYKETDGTINFAFAASGGGWTAANGSLGHCSLFANKWTHFAIVRQGSNFRYYADGILRNSRTYVGANYDNANPLYIGRYSVFPNGNRGFEGYIQDFRLYKGVAKYTTNFTPPPPMFGDYVRSTPNKIVFTPGSDYVLEARNTATGGIVTSTYSATRQWGTKPKGGIYDPLASNLVLAIPGGAVGGATSTFDVTGQIRFETPTTSYVNAGIVTYSNSLGIGTYQNRTVTNTNNVSISSTITKYYSRSMQFNGSNTYLTLTGPAIGSSDDFCIEGWWYLTSYTSPPFGNARMVYFNGPQIFRDNSNIVYGTIGSSSVYGTGVTQELGVWNHWALVRNKGEVVLYKNGIRLNVSATGNTTSVNSGTWAVGSTGSTNDVMDGNINDLRVYIGTPKYTSNFTPPNQIFLT